MLQRIFSRGASRERIEDAVEHSSAVEQSEVLRERSARILQRLERRQAEVRRAELERRRAAREAAERAERQAIEEAEAEQAAAVMTEQADDNSPEIMPAETVDAAVETPMAPEPPEAAEPDDPETLDHSVDFAEEPASEAGSADATEDEAIEVPEADDEDAVEYMPIAEAPATFDASEEEAPMQFDEPSARAEEAATAFEVETGGDVSGEPESDDREPVDQVPDERAGSGDLFADSGPLRPAGQSASGHASGPADVSGSPAPQVSSLAEEDPEAYEALCRKAEEAKARIAKRLATLQAEEEANAAASLLDIGAAAPPTARDPDDD